MEINKEGPLQKTDLGWAMWKAGIDNILLIERYNWDAFWLDVWKNLNELYGELVDD